MAGWKPPCHRAQPLSRSIQYRRPWTFLSFPNPYPLSPCLGAKLSACASHPSEFCPFARRYDPALIARHGPLLRPPLPSFVRDTNSFTPNITTEATSQWRPPSPSMSLPTCPRCPPRASRTVSPSPAPRRTSAPPSTATTASATGPSSRRSTPTSRPSTTTSRTRCGGLVTPRPSAPGPGTRRRRRGITSTPGSPTMRSLREARTSVRVSWRSTAGPASRTTSTVLVCGRRTAPSGKSQVWSSPQSASCPFTP